MSFLNIPFKVKIALAIVILLLVASAPAVYFYQQYQIAQKKINDPTGAAQDEAKATVAAVSKLILLPAGEEPTVLQVTDVARLKDQPFFINAENGDKVLIFQQAKKAILYRSSTNQIIDVAPVNLNDPIPATQSALPTPDVSFEEAMTQATQTANPTIGE